MYPTTCIPTKRSKLEWLAKHDEFVSNCSNLTIDTVFIGDSIFANFNRREHNDIWVEYFSNTSLNLSIKGDRVEHALWRVLNGEVPKSAKKVFILIGTNNVSQSNPDNIAAGIINLVRAIESKANSCVCTVLGILPRGDIPAKSCNDIIMINDILSKTQSIRFVEPSERWFVGNHIDPNLYWNDKIHLVRNGYLLLARVILYNIQRGREDDHADRVIGQPEYIGNGWSGSPNDIAKPSAKKVEAVEYDIEFPPLKSSCNVFHGVKPCKRTFSVEPKYCNNVSKYVSKPIQPSLCFSKSHQSTCNVLSSKLACPPIVQEFSPRERKKSKPSKLEKCELIRTTISKSTRFVRNTPTLVSQCPPFVQTVPLRKINKIKTPKWEKCEYVPPAITVSKLLSSSNQCKTSVSSRVKRNVNHHHRHNVKKRPIKNIQGDLRGKYSFNISSLAFIKSISNFLLLSFLFFFSVLTNSVNISFLLTLRIFYTFKTIIQVFRSKLFIIRVIFLSFFYMAWTHFYYDQHGKDFPPISPTTITKRNNSNFEAIAKLTSVFLTSFYIKIRRSKKSKYFFLFFVLFILAVQFGCVFKPSLRDTNNKWIKFSENCVFNHSFILMFITLPLFYIFLLFQRVLITNFLKFSSNLRLLFSKSEFKMKFKVGNKSNNMRLISIFCHFILIVICINYLIKSRSIQLLEKRGTYRELRYVNKEHGLSNDFLNNRQLYKYPNHYFYIIHNFFSVSFHFNPDFKISFYSDKSNIYFLNLGFVTSNNVFNDSCHKKVPFFCDNYNQMAYNGYNQMDYNNGCLYFILLSFPSLFEHSYNNLRHITYSCTCHILYIGSPCG